MLTSQLGIRLILLLGQTVPLPAPREVMEAFTNVQVTNDANQGDGFQITFSLSKSQADFNLLQSSALKPSTRVIIGVLLGATPEVLIDGIITHHQFSPSDEPGKSTLTVTGKDVSIMMDLEEKNEKYDNQPDFVIVNRLIGAYAKYGLVPMVTPTTNVPLMIQTTPWQQETDLKFIQRMAQRNGFVFYIEPKTFGVNTAYWGKENRLGIPQQRLTLGHGPSGNLKSLHFTQDALAPVSPTGTFFEPITKTAIPIPPLPSLRIPPLSASPATALRKVLMRDTANQNAGQAATSLLSTSMNAAEALTGEGEIDGVRYGHVLRARKLVNVRGVGLKHDGAYYVKRVTHTITRGDYTQSFSISREGTGALLPVAIP